MQTKEQERIDAPRTDIDQPRRSRRSRTVAALVAVSAAAALAIGITAGDSGGDTPGDRPVPTWQVVPTQPSDQPYYGSSVDG